MLFADIVLVSDVTFKTALIKYNKDFKTPECEQFLFMQQITPEHTIYQSAGDSHIKVETSDSFQALKFGLFQKPQKVHPEVRELATKSLDFVLKGILLVQNSVKDSLLNINHVLPFIEEGSIGFLTPDGKAWEWRIYPYTIETTAQKKEVQYYQPK